MSTYHALTIGPIYKTLQSVRSTKALWAASYMLSMMVRDIMKPFTVESNSRDFLMPYAKRENYFTDAFGVGLFPDQFIFIGESDDSKTLEDNIAATITSFAQKAAASLRQLQHYRAPDYADNLEEDVAAYLKGYFKIYTLCIPLAEDENPMLRIKNLLDTLELQNNYQPHEKRSFLKDLFENAYNNFLIKEGYGRKQKSGEKFFPSTIEIGTAPLEKQELKKYAEAQEILRKAENAEKEKKGKEKLKGKRDAQQEFLTQLNTDFSDNLRFHHKYIAVVLADGDNMGTFIKQLFSNDKDKQGQSIAIKDRFSRFSEQLMKFSLASVQLIKAYSGTAVYAGGDDLLFFAPVAACGDVIPEGIERLFTSEDLQKVIKEGEDEPSTKTIFWLVKKIDALFRHFILEDAALKPIIARIKDAPPPSMSYGISISYYKFPLNEALEQATSQLKDTAKKTPGKNAVSWTVLKHSGQFFGTTFTKGTESFNAFQTLLDVSLTGKNNFITSLTHKLESQKEVLAYAAQEKETLKAFFDNNFNERIHLGIHDNYLKEVRTLIYHVFKEGKGQKTDDLIKRIYGALRFIHFLLAPYNEQD